MTSLIALTTFPCTHILDNLMYFSVRDLVWEWRSPGIPFVWCDVDGLENWGDKCGYDFFLLSSLSPPNKNCSL